jgi:hypothetical protein
VRKDSAHLSKKDSSKLKDKKKVKKSMIMKIKDGLLCLVSSLDFLFNEFMKHERASLRS